MEEASIIERQAISSSTFISIPIPIAIHISLSLSLTLHLSSSPALCFDPVGLRFLPFSFFIQSKSLFLF